MSLRKLPAVNALERPEGWQWDAPSDALERWAASPCAAASDNPDTITIFDVIGADFWTGGGFTAKRMSAALRTIGADKPVEVQVNSPGGDMFEGLAIYNLLREHKAEVTVKVMGLAASAASIIAMAGDTIEVGLGSFIMIHNAWGIVVGNRNDMRGAADTFDQFDAAMRDIYRARTGQSDKDLAKMMDAETFMSAADAIDKGFADRTFEQTDAGVAARVAGPVSAQRRLDAALAKQGMPRTERRRLLKEITGTPGAAGSDTPCAVFDPAAARRLIDAFQSY